MRFLKLIFWFIVFCLVHPWIFYWCNHTYRLNVWDNYDAHVHGVIHDYKGGTK